MPAALSQINWTRTFYVVASTATIVAMLWWLQALLLPMVMAILLTFLMAPVVNWIERKLTLGRSVAVVAVLALAVAMLVSVTWIISNQFVSLIDSLPQYEVRLRERVTDLHLSDGVMKRLERMIIRVRRDIESQATQDSPGVGRERVTAVRIVESPSLLSARTLYDGLAPMAGTIATFAFTFVLVVFFLLGREDLRDRVMVLAGADRLALTTKALDEAGERISGYMLRQAMVNAGFGLIVGIGLYLLGLPQAAMFGFIAGVLRYLPYVGPMVAIVLPLTMAFLTGGSWALFLQVAAFLGVAELVTNLVIETKVYGRGIGLSDSATIVMVAFWTWLWGPLGLLVGMPMSVCLLVLGRHVKAMAFLSVLLGDKPALEPHLGVYQRLLAGRIDEARDLVDEQEQVTDRAIVLDDLLLPALAQARADASSGALQRLDFESFVENAAILARDLAEEIDSKEEEAPSLHVLSASPPNAANAVALDMLGSVLLPRNIALGRTSKDMRMSQVVERAITEKVRVFVLASFASAGAAHLRLMTNRLRTRDPDLYIVVARWCASEDDADVTEGFRAAGADVVVTTIADARDAIVRVAGMGKQQHAQGTFASREGAAAAAL